jgi:hypothetical protein
MTLKTLKDIPHSLIAEAIKGKSIEKEKLKVMQEWIDYNFVRKQDLKQEAIKWIKAAKRKSKTGNDRLILWIKHFFNITEKDLK